MKTLTLGATYILSPHASNELRFNLSKSDQDLSYSLDSFGGATPFAVTNITALNRSPQNWFYFAATYDLQAAVQLLPESTRQRQINITDTFNLGAGHHNLKFGIDYRS